MKFSTRVFLAWQVLRGRLVTASWDHRNGVGRTHLEFESRHLGDRPLR